MKNIAIIFGGVSPEYGVSLQSAHSVISSLDREKYNPVPVGISKEGKWFYFTGDTDRIKDDTWCSETDCVPAVLPPDRTEHKLMLYKMEHEICAEAQIRGDLATAWGISVENNKKIIGEIPLDAVFPVLHGKNGEDGTVQGLVELAGIPLIGCGTLSSALCMDKDRAHKLAAASGVRCAKAVVLTNSRGADKACDFAEEIGFPVFVKPVKAGSSYGMTKVEHVEKLLPAITLAFKYDNRVIMEETIDGFEVGCAVCGSDRLVVGEVDEIALNAAECANGFFDYTEKYTLQNASIHVPARIPTDKAQEIKDTAKKLYRALDCSGFARVDMFLTPEGEIVFNEINTIPGFTGHSRYPNMMKAAGYGFTEVLDLIIGQTLEKEIGNDRKENKEQQ